ncbi:MAG: plastocyanin/azurin family copper-binding protein [Acidimicrobiia bacterium]
MAVVVLLVSCGGGGGDEASYQEPKGPVEATISIDAGNFYFDPDKIDAAPGITEIQLVGQGGLHDFVFDNGKYPGFLLEVSGDSETDELKVDLEPGKYVFYCNFPSHRQQGMEGTITVK